MEHLVVPSLEGIPFLKGAVWASYGSKKIHLYQRNDATADRPAHYEMMCDSRGTFHADDIEQAIVKAGSKVEQHEFFGSQMCSKCEDRYDTIKANQAPD